MSKRRLNKQQQIRVRKIQERYQQKADVDVAAEKGLVLTRFGSHAEVEGQACRRIYCSIRPNIDSLVAGDRVLWRPEAEGRGVVISRYPRTSVLGRSDRRGQFRPMAANVTQLIIVVAVKPALSWLLLDSYLVIAERLALQAIIVLNKVDLPCEKIKQELVACYQPLGYRILLTSHCNHQGYEQLQQVLDQQTSVFVGQSGVGKSSLLTQLLPHESFIQTTELSERSELGCHTTSYSRYYHLPNGGALIDSPGVREFALWQMSAVEVAQGYRELYSLLSQCKFRNCNHKNSPGCAIISALEQGHVAGTRYNSFIRLMSSALFP